MDTLRLYLKHVLSGVRPGYEVEPGGVGVPAEKTSHAVPAQGERGRGRAGGVQSGQQQVLGTIHTQAIYLVSGQLQRAGPPTAGGFF